MWRPVVALTDQSVWARARSEKRATLFGSMFPRSSDPPRARRAPRPCAASRISLTIRPPTFHSGRGHVFAPGARLPRWRAASPSPRYLRTLTSNVWPVAWQSAIRRSWSPPASRCAYAPGIPGIDSSRGMAGRETEACHARGRHGRSKVNWNIPARLLRVASAQ